MSKVNNSSTIELRMELAQEMIDSWSREDLMTFAWDRLVDELGELNETAMDNLCEQFDIPAPDTEVFVYDVTSDKTILEQFYGE